VNRALALFGTLLPSLIVMTFATAPSSATQTRQTLTAPRPDPTFFYHCNSETKLCTCSGAENCIKLSNSGKCNGSVTNTTNSEGYVTGGQCNWNVATKAPTRGPSGLSSGVRPQRFDCYYFDDSAYCDCKVGDDCDKLGASGQCTGPLVGDDVEKQCPTV